MQRYGYEGYPVVKNDEIIGLVTRRAVDRAILHKLNLTAAGLMEAGDVHVHPDHAIEYLQNVITDTGWGQIPVVERDSHNIIGIVTRTDLLKTLSPHKNTSKRRNLADKLASALPSSWLTMLKEIADYAGLQHAAIYIVGGFVRDLLLKRPSWILISSLRVMPSNWLSPSRPNIGGRITTHKRFGTAKWFLDEDREPGMEKRTANQPSAGSRRSPETSSQLPEALDFITARREFYTHPQPSLL